MAFELFPGNIKQYILPFVLDPNNTLNSKQSDYSGKPQFFSFRNPNGQNTSAKTSFGSNNCAKLQICPSTISNLTKDISYQMLFNKPEEGNAPITIDSLFEQLPAIQIREFLPDSRLDQFLDFSKNILESALKQIMNTGQALKEKGLQGIFSQVTDSLSKVDSNTFDKILNVTQFIIRYLTGFTDSGETFATDSFNQLDKLRLQNNIFNPTANVKASIANMPFSLWYQLQSCTNTNIYEIPFISDSKTIYSSNGTNGWPSAGISFNDMVEKMAGGKIIGKVAKSLLNNINIMLSPWWDPTQGGVNTPYNELKIKFDLFNDSAESALYNFIFVNTIIPNAKWLQYSMFQHSPCLYDVKIEGFDRMFICAGNFIVQQKGVLRSMPNSWLNNYLRPKINKSFDQFGLIDNIRLNNLLKIPDVYTIELNFKSLLPDNLNNYIFNYIQQSNFNIEVRNRSIAKDILTTGTQTMLKKAKEVWDGSRKASG